MGRRRRRPPLGTPRSPADTADARRHHELSRLRVLLDADGLAEPHLVAEAGVPGFAAYWTPGAQDRAARTRGWLEVNRAAIHAAAH